MLPWKRKSWKPKLKNSTHSNLKRKISQPNQDSNRGLQLYAMTLYQVNYPDVPLEQPPFHFLGPVYQCHLSLKANTFLVLLFKVGDFNVSRTMDL